MYTLAAEQGNAGAQFKLGTMYSLGLGILQNRVAAHVWFNIAASYGHEDAVTARDEEEKKMKSSDVNYARLAAQRCISAKLRNCFER